VLKHSVLDEYQIVSRRLHLGSSHETLHFLRATRNQFSIALEGTTASEVSTMHSIPSTYDRRSFRAAHVRSAVAKEPRRHILS
jgi:hypothetical protein